MLWRKVCHIFRTGRYKSSSLFKFKFKKFKVHRWSTKTVSSTSAMTSKFKFEVARSRGESDRCWPISRERNVLEISKLIGKLSTARTIMRPRFKVKGQRSRSPGRLMLRQEVRHIFWTGRPTNFKLGTQTQHEDPHLRQAPWPSRSKVKVARSRAMSQGRVMRLTGVGR